MLSFSKSACSAIRDKVSSLLSCSWSISTTSALALLITLSQCSFLASFLFESTKVAATAREDDKTVKVLPTRILRLEVEVVTRRAREFVADTQDEQLQ